MYVHVHVGNKRVSFLFQNSKPIFPKYTWNLLIKRQAAIISVKEQSLLALFADV